MDFALTSEEERFCQECTDYLKGLKTPELMAELETRSGYGGGPAYTKLVRQLGEDGWLGVGWPKEYGGQGRTPMEQHLFYEICFFEEIPLPVLGLNTVGPTLMQIGSEEQKNRYLPPILKGEMEVCVGYSEPDAGTDLASLKTTAVRDGDHYIINGQKVFTTNADFADYVWLAARTDPNAPKHKGLSVFMVPMSTPGITIQPFMTIGGERTNYTFYDNVKIPVDCLVGEENQGWKYMTTQLNFERVAVVPFSPMKRNIEQVTQWAKETRLDGRAVIEVPWVRQKLTELTVELEILKLLNYHMVWMVTNGMTPYAQSSVVKVVGVELYQRTNGTLLQIMGQFGQLQRGSKWAQLKGKLEHDFRKDLVLIFGGGALEVQRNIIAMAGLGLPRTA
ncbi:MAG: acyl-CoA dehydrogenase family protein [Chloroflexi bacterium]|nr:acyl-CoA dehydrogenase family protein [Chloroflexota bacterium]